jgi:hypothetical protein
MAVPLTSKQAESSNINEFVIVSNKNQGNTVDIKTGIVNLLYYESILQDTIKVTATFADTGNSVTGSGGGSKSVLEGLPLVGQETTKLKFTDSSDNEIKVDLYVNKITPQLQDTTKSMVTIDLVSKEFILNEKVRLNTRFDGKISDHILRILTDPKFLGTKKKVDIEETFNTYNFIGNNRKPYYAMNWLSKKAVPNLPGADGNTAGYFFFETSEGFKFKSIDSMLSQEKKKSLIYTETPDSKGENIPSGYDGKIIEHNIDNRVDVKEKLKMGAFSNKIIMFDPFNCFYEVINPSVQETERNLKKAGKELPKLNPEFNRTEAGKDFSRTTYMLVDTGTLPEGNTKQQIEKSKEVNFDSKKILNQAIMRYNQLYSIKTTITIPGDFSLHAGDAIFIDNPSLSDEQTQGVDREFGGLYIIADLCHYVSTKETFTKLNLVRDSFGRIGNHTKGSIPL